MSKVSVIGAGNVGATCAYAMSLMQVASEVILLDVKPGLAEGKAIDMMQTAKHLKFETRIAGVTNDYKTTENSDVIVITSGIPRKPGMTREELIGTNASIVNEVVNNSLKYSPNAILVIISNPMDTMTYLTLKSSGLPKNKVIGMGGVLDSSRFVYYLSRALDAPASDVAGLVIGGHGDTTMIPLVRFANLRGIPVSELTTKDVLDQIVEDTMKGGATLTKLIGTSAWYAPGANAAALVRAIVHDERKVYPCCVYLEGEYFQNDICIGVPCIIGKNGWEKIIELNLNLEERTLFQQSADAVRITNNVLKELKLV